MNDILQPTAELLVIVILLVLVVILMLVDVGVYVGVYNTAPPDVTFIIPMKFKLASELAPTNKYTPPDESSFVRLPLVTALIYSITAFLVMILLAI